MCAQTFTGCPARSGSRLAATSRRIAFGERVVVPLLLGPVVLRPGRGGQRVQHLAQDRRALRGQVPVEDASTLEGGLQPHPRSANPRAGSSSGSSDRARSYISANSADRSASPSPAARPLTSSSSDSSRNFSGSRSVHWQIARA